MLLPVTPPIQDKNTYEFDTRYFEFVRGIIIKNKTLGIEVYVQTQYILLVQSIELG